MRQIATTADVYGPSAGMTVATTELHAPAAAGAGKAGVNSGRAAIPVTQLFQGMAGSFMAQPILWLGVLVLVLIAYKLIEEHRGGREAFEEIKLGGNNVVKIGLVAMLFFAIARFLATRYSVPGASAFVLYSTGGSTSS